MDYSSKVSIFPPDFHGKNILFPFDVWLDFVVVNWIFYTHEVVKA